MDENGSTENIIQQSKARELADAFLRERYYDSEKIEFQACEDVRAGEQLIYRFSGLLIEKSRALIDRLARDKSSVTYKFVVEVDSNRGKVLTYYLT
jgi:hypothetical protein